MQKLWQQAAQQAALNNSADMQFMIYILIMAHNKNEARYTRAAGALDIQAPTEGATAEISFEIKERVDINKIRPTLPPGLSLGARAEKDIQNLTFTGHVYKFVVAYITNTLKPAQKHLAALSRKLSFSSQGNTSPGILTTEISEEQETVVNNIFDAYWSQVAYYRCMQQLKPLLPCFVQALDTYNKIWNHDPESYARLDQDSRLPVTYGGALIYLLKEPLIHIKSAYRVLKFARRTPPTPLANLFNGNAQDRINVVDHRWPQDRTMADVKEALKRTFAGKDEKSQKILQQVKELTTSHHQQFAKLNANRNLSQSRWDGKHMFTGSVHCESIVAVDLIKHVK
jgi:hypothetical protein